MKHFVMTAVLPAVLALSSAGVFADEHFFDSGGTQIRYTIDGEGEPVILVHGYRANGDMNWRMPGVTRLLANGYRVITIDNRGHGKSEEPRDDRYGIEMVNDVVRLMDHLQLKDAHLAGYSMGGMITIKLLTLHPERVRSAVIGGMGWYRRSPGSDRGDETPADKYAKVARDFHQLSTTEAEIQAIQTPLVVIVGTEDHGQLDRVRDWQAAVPGLPVVYIEDAAHASCIFKPRFRESVLEFIERQSESER